MSWAVGGFLLRPAASAEVPYYCTTTVGYRLQELLKKLTPPLSECQKFAIKTLLLSCRAELEDPFVV